MSSTVDQSEIGQQHREHRINPASLLNLRPAWTPGASPNPGGRPKNRPQTTVILDRLSALTVDELLAYEPQNAAESACKLQILNAATNVKALEALPSWKEITDRTEGKAPQKMTIEAIPADDETRIANAIARTRAEMEARYELNEADVARIEVAVRRAFDAA